MNVLMKAVILVLVILVAALTADAQCVSGSCRIQGRPVARIVTAPARAVRWVVRDVQPVRRVISLPMRVRPLQGYVMPYQRSQPMFVYRRFGSCR